MKPTVKGFFDPDTFTVTYVVYEGPGQPAVVIDSVLNYDHKSGATSTVLADQVIAFVRENRLVVEWILETHAHADHLTAAPYLKSKLGGKIAIGNHIKEVQGVFKNIFNLGAEFSPDGRQFDELLNENQELVVGNLTLKALYVPGHTPACMAYVVGDAIFVGDTLFMPDVGSARCDFPGGDAHKLYQSAKKILSHPEETRLFMCHDYPPDGRQVAFETTVREQRSRNIHLHDGVSEDAFVAMRTARDATLAMPVLILPSIQVNIRAGHLPPAESNGVVYLKIPVDQLTK
jgi:glyoxylase-like metal-dependent hydrolase (beta-lactamase superfamily II)